MPRFARNYGLNVIPLNYAGLLDRAGMSNSPVGQVSPVLRARLNQWTDGGARGNLGVDVLPPELRVNLENLRPQQHSSDDTPINVIVNESDAGSFNNQALLVGIADQLVLRQPSTKRIYLMIVNTHPTQVLYVRFGAISDAVIGMPIAANFGSYELDNVIPQDDIHIVANGANTTGVLIYSNKG